MTDKTEVLMKSELFSGVSAGEIGKFLARTDCFTRTYGRGEYVMRAGDVPEDFGIVLSGGLTALKPAADGRENVLSVLCAGDHFADILVSAGNKESPVSLFVEENGTEILNISLDAIIAAEDSTSRSVLKNLLGVISAKYWSLFRKIEYMSVLPLKKRVCRYLSDCATAAESNVFTVDFDREGLASYLNADRSALCRILSELRREGAINYRKNRFEISDFEKLKF